MKSYQNVLDDLSKFANIKTSELDKYNKELIKNLEDVCDLKHHVLSNQLVHRTYFQVSLGILSTAEEQFEFIEKNEDLLQDWWHVDQLVQFIKRPVHFSFAFDKAQKYILSSKPFVRRWGYVLFMTGLQKDSNTTTKILSLIKDDDEYYVQMAEAWLIADLAVFNVEVVKRYLQTSTIKYNILGKAIQKMCDSFRISQEDKLFVKSLRGQLKNN